MNFDNPLKVQVIRGQQIESSHNVHVMVCDSNENTIYSQGTLNQKIYPRSAIKALQALALFTTGAYKKFSLTPSEITLACASHSGQTEHVEVIRHWLLKLGLSTENLECGGHWPTNQNAAHELIKKNNSYSAIHNNCSGKHTGFLADALALEVDTKNYIQLQHPVQKEVKKLIENFCSYQIDNNSIAIDGCSIPTYFMPLKSLALGMARFADIDNSQTELSTAKQIIFNSIQQNPFYLAGQDRYCTLMTTELGENGFVKIGAEGVIMASLPKNKLGIVIKSEDGASRSTELAMTWVLKQLNILSENTFNKFSEVPVENWNRIRTGQIKVEIP